jgi:uncharacterized phiE125 gp8 family phage protein
MLNPVLQTAPTVDPITLAEAKAWARIDHSDSDTLLALLISAAVAHCDGFKGVYGQAMVNQTWYQDFDCFTPKMRLPVGPVLDAVKDDIDITYADADGNDVTVDPSNYYLFTDELGPYIAPAPDYSWPSTQTRADAVRITWTAGFGAAASDVPANFKMPLLFLVAHWYETREPVAIGSDANLIPATFDALVAPIRRVGC